MARVALVYPPTTDPRSPHLPLPALAASLRANGVETRLFDLDLDSMLAVMRPESLREARRAARARGALDARLEAVGERLPESIDASLATLRDRVRFLDPHARLAAREDQLDALELVSAGAERPLSYSVHPMRYDVAGVDAGRLADLVEVTADPRANVFHRHWTDEIIPAIEADRPTLVGVSITSRQQTIPALSFARALRRRGHFVVLGGTFIARFREPLLESPEFFEHFADAVVVYEGETALLELLAQLEGGRELERVPNLLYRAKDAVRMTRTHLESVAELPTPDFTGMPLDRYLIPEPVLPVMLGKGCYHDLCEFCESSYVNRISPKRYRVRPLDRVVDDLLTHHARHGARRFILADEAAPPKLLSALADRLEARGAPPFAFEAYARITPDFSDELLAKLSRMGLRKLFLGLESADQRTLDHMQKGIRFEHVEPMLERCERAGIHYHVFGLLGLPEEPIDAAERTADFFRSPRFDRVGQDCDVHPMQIHLRSPYARRLDALGVEYDRAELDSELVHGLGTRWENTRGISREETTRLYQALARDRMERPEVGPRFLWPGLEAWGLYYSDNYRGREFPYRLSLPSEGAGGYSLRLGRSVVELPGQGDMRALAVRDLSLELPAPLVGVLSRLGELPLPRALAALGDDEETRRAVTQLLRARILELVPC